MDPTRIPEEEEDDGATDDAPSGDGTWLDDAAGDPSGDVLTQIGKVLEDVLNYAHDVDDEPPPRTGPYPAGGPS